MSILAIFSGAAAQQPGLGVFEDYSVLGSILDLFDTVPPPPGALLVLIARSSLWHY